MSHSFNFKAIALGGLITCFAGSARAANLPEVLTPDILRAETCRYTIDYGGTPLSEKYRFSQMPWVDQVLDEFIGKKECLDNALSMKGVAGKPEQWKDLYRWFQKDRLTGDNEKDGYHGRSKKSVFYALAVMASRTNDHDIKKDIFNLLVKCARPGYWDKIPFKLIDEAPENVKYEMASICIEQLGRTGMPEADVFFKNLDVALKEFGKNYDRATGDEEMKKIQVPKFLKDLGWKYSDYDSRLEHGALYGRIRLIDMQKAGSFENYARQP